MELRGNSSLKDYFKDQVDQLLGFTPGILRIGVTEVKFSDKGTISVLREERILAYIYI